MVLPCLGSVINRPESGAIAELKRSGLVGSELDGGEPAETGVWSLDVVVGPPSLDDPAGLPEALEQVLVEALQDLELQRAAKEPVPDWRCITDMIRSARDLLGG